MRKLILCALVALTAACAVSMRYPWDKQQDRHEVKPTPLPTPKVAPTALPTPPPAATQEPPPPPTPTPERVVKPRPLDCVVMFPTGDAKSIPCPVTPTPTPEVIR